MRNTTWRMSLRDAFVGGSTAKARSKEAPTDDDNPTVAAPAPRARPLLRRVRREIAPPCAPAAPLVPPRLLIPPGPAGRGTPAPRRPSLRTPLLLLVGRSLLPRRAGEVNASRWVKVRKREGIQRGLTYR